jgi:hypothetical protein
MYYNTIVSITTINSSRIKKMLKILIEQVLKVSEINGYH